MSNVSKGLPAETKNDLYAKHKCAQRTGAIDS